MEVTSQREGIVLTRKTIKGKRARVTPDGSSYAYAQGKFWVLRDLKTEAVLYRGNSLRDVEDYLESLL